MGLTSGAKWGIAGSAFGLALIIFSRFMFYMMDMVFGSKGWIAEEKGSKPTMWGMLLHSLVLGFAIFGILAIDWTCE
jgi:hypothetical protein